MIMCNSVMVSTAQPWNRSLLLELTGETLDAILGLGKVNGDEALWLWLTGNRALQARLRKHVTRIAFVKHETSKGRLPNFLSSFPHLTSFQMICPDHKRQWPMDYVAIANMLKTLPSTLKKLHLVFSPGDDQSSAVRLLVPPANPTEPDAEPSSPLLDLKQTFPALLTLILDTQIQIPLDRGVTLPDSLLSLEHVRYLMPTFDPTVEWAEALPRGLERWAFEHPSPPDLSVDFLRALPPNLMKMISLPDITSELMPYLPSMLGSLEFIEIRLDQARVLPPSLTTLIVRQIPENVDAILELLPQTLIEFVWSDGAPDSGLPSNLTLRRLPRALKSLSMALDGEKVADTDFPPGLTSLTLATASTNLSQTSFAAALPRSLVALQIAGTQPQPFEDGYITNLPRQLAKLECNPENIADFETLAFPPHLTRLGAWWHSYDEVAEAPSFPFHKLPSSLTDLFIKTLPIAQMHHLPPLNLLKVDHLTNDGFDPTSEELISKAMFLREYGLPFEMRQKPAPGAEAPKRPERVGFLDLLPRTMQEFAINQALLEEAEQVDDANFPFLRRPLSDTLKPDYD